jgi:hypothetical protein
LIRLHHETWETMKWNWENNSLTHLCKI